MMSVFGYPEELPASYDGESILYKIEQALPILKNHTWPLRVSEDIQNKIDHLEQCFQILKNTKKNHRHTDSFLQARQGVVSSLDGIFQILESVYYDPQKQYNDLHSYLIHHHVLYAEEIQNYYHLATQLFAPQGSVDFVHLPSVEAQLDHFRSLADPDRKNLALQKMALTLAIEEKQNGLVKRMHIELTDPQCFPSKDLEKLNHYKKEFLNMKKKQIPSFLKALSERSKKAQKKAMWMENRACYLMNKPLKHPMEYSLEAMLAYLSYWVDRYITPQSLISREHKALVFSKSIQDVRDYTHAWKSTKPR